ncbi:hypothetical protein NL529_30810, partial [Klebsiella pneumoniae]|nr:hypothetical protein [Klebsiella pneumoniae]
EWDNAAARFAAKRASIDAMQIDVEGLRAHLAAPVAETSAAASAQSTPRPLDDVRRELAIVMQDALAAPAGTHTLLTHPAGVGKTTA